MPEISQETTGKAPLTAEQNRIIKTTRRAVEVLAYAGTGKTTTLVARVEKLLMRGARPKDIVVLTFSKEGVRVLKVKLPEGVTVRTMHSYALSVVKPRPRLPSDKQVGQWLRAALDKELGGLNSDRRDLLVDRLGTPPDVRMVTQILDMMAATGKGAKDLGISQSDRFRALAYYPSFFDRLAKRFAAAVKDRGYIRYGDMIRRGIEALEQGAEVPFKHLLVDEWQDSSAAQGQLVQALADRLETVMVLGDPRQAIFGFSGASPMRLRTLLGKAKTYPLTVSFRLTQTDAALANAFIRQEEPKAPAIQGRPEAGYRPWLVVCPDKSKQAEWVVEQVRLWIKQGVAPSSIAILARMKRSLRDVEQELRYAGLNSTAVNNKAGVPWDELKAALKLIAKIEDLRDHPCKEQRLRRLLEKNAKRDVPQTTMNKYSKNLSGALVSDSKEGLYAACCAVVLGIGFAGASAKRKALQIELNRWRALSNEFDSFALLREEVRDRSTVDQVRTTTVHSAKGGEWDYVIVLNVANGSMPHYTARRPGLVMDEERSVFYVAITRAKKQLVLVEAEFDHPDNRLKGRSLFLQDRTTMKSVAIRGL